MKTLRIPADLREQIARAILEDEANPNGEHLFDGEQVIFYCPMQGHGLPPDRSALVPVRDLLPEGVRIPTFGDYLSEAATPAAPLALPRAEREALQAAYERAAIDRLAGALPEQVTLR